MKPYLLCFDVDGTLRDNVDHKICPSTDYTIKQLKKNGYKIIISSGRGYDSLKKTGLMEMYDWDGYVLNNGQMILDGQGNILADYQLSKETIQETIELANQLNMCLVLKCEPRIMNKEADEYVYTSQRYFNNTIAEVGVYTNQKVDAMITYGPIGYDYAPFCSIQGLEVLPGESTYADLTIKGVSKATGIKKLLDHYHLDQYIAFGDSLNDVEMFKHAAISIAMGQGNQKLKDIATYVTSSIDDDGIYKACLHYHLLEE